MIQLVNIVLKVDKQIKKKFYDLCYSLKITPMRTMLILMDRFGDGKIDALPIIEDYKTFKGDEKITKTNRILKYRIDGKQAYKINSKNKNLTDTTISDNIKPSK